MHVTRGATIRALAAGVVESFVDEKGRTSVTLKADDGTKYWYAEVETYILAEGVRVSARPRSSDTRSQAKRQPLPELSCRRASQSTKRRYCSWESRRPRRRLRQ